MHWSSVTILLALLFATAYSQRGGHRYHPDQLLEESSSEENHRFQTRSRGDVGDARRGDGRRTRVQETTEASQRQLGSRSRAKTEETRQFHSLSGSQLTSRKTSHEAEPQRFTSREETRNERFNSRESSATTESNPRNQESIRSRSKSEGRDLEYKTRGTNTIRISSTGTQERGEHRRTNHDLERPSSRGSRRQENRDRTQIIRNGNVIEPPKRIEPVTERFQLRQSSKEELQKTLDETTEINVSSNEYKPITEAKIQDFSRKYNSIEVEKTTRPVDIASTENFNVRQSSREEGRKVRFDPSNEKNDSPQVRGRKKSQELPTRGGGMESRRRTRPIDTPVTERFHSRQLSREDIPMKRGRFATSTEQLRNYEEHDRNTRLRGSKEFRTRGNGIVFDKRKLPESTPTERTHSKQSAREKFKYSRIEDSTTQNREVLPVTSEVDKTLEMPNKEANVIESENKQTDNLVSELTTEIKTSVHLDELNTTTKQSDPLPTENTVDFPIKSNDVEEANRTSRKLDSNIPKRNSYQRGLNRDFESSNRGRLESSLSRERIRVAQGPSTKATEGRRSSRRFNTQSTDATQENINENIERRKLQRPPSRTRITDTSDVRGRSRLIESPVRHRNKDLPAARSRTDDRIPEAVLLPEIITESRTEGKFFSEIQIEQKNEVTIGAPTETSVTSTQRSLGRTVAFKKPGNRGRGQSKAFKAIEEKEQHSGEVRDDDNYPEVYKQLKKSGTDSKDILALLKARKEVREKLQKTNSKHFQPVASLKPSERPVFGSTTTPPQEVTAPHSNFRSRNYNDKIINQRSDSKLPIKEETENFERVSERNERFSNFKSSRSKSQRLLDQNSSDSQTTAITITELKEEVKLLEKDKKYNPYNNEEIRSFNRKKNSNLPIHRNLSYRNTLKNHKTDDKQIADEKLIKHNIDDQDPIKHKITSQLSGPVISRSRGTIKNTNADYVIEKAILYPNDDLTENAKKYNVEKKAVPGTSRFRNTFKSDINRQEKKVLKERDELNEPVTEETSKQERKLGFTGFNRVRNTLKNHRREEREEEEDESDQIKKQEFLESGSDKLQRRPSFAGTGKSHLKTDKNKNNGYEISSPEEQTESADSSSKYTPRNREKEYQRFKARTEKTLSDVSSKAPLLKPKYNLFNRDEHSSFRRRSFVTPTSEGIESTALYKNSMITPRTRTAYVPQRKTFVKSTTTFTPLSHSRFRARKGSLSRLLNEDDLKVDNSEDHKLTFHDKEEDDDLRPDINHLNIDSLVSETEQSSITTEGGVILSARKRPRYTESHIQRVPPKGKKSETFQLSRALLTTIKPEVYTVLAVPYVEESYSNFIPETTTVVSTEFKFEIITESTTTLSESIETTTPITITTEATSTTETSNTSTNPSTTTTEIPTSSTSIVTTEATTIKTTTTTEPMTTEPKTASTTTTETIRSTTEPTTITETTDGSTMEQTTTTEATTTTTTKPTTTTRLTTRPTPTTTRGTTRPTTTTKRPTTTKKLASGTTKSTTKKPNRVTTQRPISSTRTAQLKSSAVTTKMTTKIAPMLKSTHATTRKTTIPVATKPTIQKSTTKATTSKITISDIKSSTSSTTKVTQLTTTFKIDDLLSTTHPNFLSTIAYLARNLTMQPTSYENSNTANFRASSAPTENTTPMQQQMTVKTDNYVVYGLLPNNNVVRKVVKTTKAPIDVPFYIYGLYPNGTIVRRFPNGTIVPEETDEENEVIGSIEPGSQESLETVVKKDNPLSYLYPPSFKKTSTSTTYTPSTASPSIAINRDKSNDASTTEIVPIDPRFGVLPPSNIEKPAMALKDSDTLSAKASTSNTKLISTMPTPTTSKSGSKHNTNVIASKPTAKVTTNKPTTKATTRKPTMKATTTKPVTKAINLKPTMKAATTKPAIKAPTKKPTTKATTNKPTTKTATNKPTTKAAISKPTTKATTSKPTTKAITSKPAVKATTTKQTTKATTVKPSTKAPLYTTVKPAPRTITSKGTTPKTITKSTPKAVPKPTTVRSTSRVTSKKPSTPATTTKATVKTPTLKKTQANKPTTNVNGKKQEKSTIKTPKTPLSDAELLNNLLNQVENNKISKGTTESSAHIADKVIQLAIKRAQKSTVAPLLKDITHKEDLQQLSSTTTSVKKQTSGINQKENSNNLIEEEKTNKTGKISVWVIPPGESTTTSKSSSGVSQSEAELLNVLLSSPNAIDKLSLSDQLLLAEVLSSTAFPQTTRKKKKKTKTSTTTTTPAPPTFPILQYLFGRNRGNGGGLFQRGLFRGGGLRGLESGGTTVPDDGGIFQNDGLPRGQGELAAESQEDPQQGERGGLVNAALNVSRAVSQFMGFVIQGAANSFQNYFQTRTRALAESLSYPES